MYINIVRGKDIERMIQCDEYILDQLDKHTISLVTYFRNEEKNYVLPKEGTKIFIMNDNGDTIAKVKV